MEYRNDDQFEKDLINSVENHEPVEQPERSSENMEEHVQAVDADFSVETVNEEKAEESSYEEAKMEPSSGIPENEHLRSSGKWEKKSPKKGFVKGFASTIAAGVIGSVLTLTVLPHTDYMEKYYPEAANHSASGSDSSSQVKPVSAQPSITSSNSIADTVEKVSKSIVGIVNFQQQQSVDFFGNASPSQSVESGSGSGVIFQKNNSSAYIVTNNHVIEGASKLEVSLYNGEKTTATVVGSDALTDLAVLKIDAKYVTDTAVFGDSSKLRPGDRVYAIGNPLGLNLSRTVTQGIISATERSIPVTTSAGSWETNVIQTDAAINPGNSGGALINEQGQVIGINSLKISQNGVEGLGFAIPSNDAIPIVNQLIKNGKINRPYLGVGLADLNEVPQVYWQGLPENVKQGVLVMNIDPNSAAARAGFQPKDVIVSMNGTAINNASDLRKYLYSKAKIGDEIKVEVYREGQKKTLTVNLTSNRND